MPRRKGSDSQTNLPFSRSPSREQTPKVHCDNCQARFVAWYGTEEEEEADTETIDVEKCGLCGGDAFKDTVIRLIAQVTARNVNRD